MPKYMTRQREALLTYLKAHTDEQLSAQQIAEALQGERVSQSAVYRNIAELEAEGVLCRSRSGSEREVRYRYVGGSECRGCLHLSCKRCGRTFHLDERGTEELMRAVDRAEGFTVDKADTVLYGLCELCRE